MDKFGHLFLNYNVLVLTIIINYSDGTGWAWHHIWIGAVESDSELLWVLNPAVILDWDSHTGSSDTLTEN